MRCGIAPRPRPTVRAPTFPNLDRLEVHNTLYDFEEYGVVTHPAALTKPQAGEPSPL